MLYNKLLSFLKTTFETRAVFFYGWHQVAFKFSVIYITIYNPYLLSLHIGHNNSKNNEHMIQ